MKFVEVVKEAFVLVGFSAAGRWDGKPVYPIPNLWAKAYEFIVDRNVDKIIGICLPPRSDHYFYTCGLEIDGVRYDKIEEGMNLHTFPKQKYVVFTHVGPANHIPNTYGELWTIFDKHEYQLKEGMPEIEIVKKDMFGKEEEDYYEMEIWLPIE
ncbi:AraC family transcriptional regulator [Priestia megaterium]|nr:AraC family transcriptional regulator [Priestia megaterium]